MNSNEYMNAYMKERYGKRRSEAIAYLGGVCIKCNSADRLEIDHKNTEEKTFDLSKAFSGWSWKRIQPELDKCQVLCYDCHKEKTRKDLAKKFNQREHWEHGTLTGYANKKCKCEECLKVGREYQRKRKGLKH